MANEEFLKKAVEAFEALSPEQKSAMLEDQRQSWVRGNIGLSRDERGITTPVMPKNTRPCAPVEGLEMDKEATAENIARHISTSAKSGRIHEPTYVAAKAGALMGLECSQAETIIAAERAEKEEAENGCLAAVLIIKGLEADNAALTARVKELEKDFYDADKSDMSARDMLNDQDTKIESLETVAVKMHQDMKALETQLAAATGLVSSAKDIIPGNYMHWHDCARKLKVRP